MKPSLRGCRAFVRPEETAGRRETGLLSFQGAGSIILGPALVVERGDDVFEFVQRTREEMVFGVD